ncbi:sulfurtransferase complex subunit TusC [Halomonas sp. 18H]|uniref:sulfurtransferase complex subunit TusC n=1 Tax=Halomonas almeriensis TaxID=308163 RepID=UPI002230E24F|nr:MULTISPECIES: sulfurtransferase complex subunit TusC [Halomonas]MCW4151899.1 sulfurtransferase complex subunit TusC [Halomonas sp. 18H]MDN3554145.1 sulfurtransferase complex subunit TusC [Halomonas almeriensis]
MPYLEEQNGCSTKGDILLVLRHAPHGSSWLREGLDIALVGAAFDRDVSLLFMGEGVLALLSGQQAGALGQKGTHPTLQMLEMYDIDALFVEQRAMERYGLVQEDLILAPQGLEEAGMADLIKHHDLVLTF